jgi:ech hydrogenase subunit D
MKKKKRHAIPIDKSELLGQVAQMKREGFRLVHICCTTLADGYEITYSFDKSYKLVNYRVVVPKADPTIPSITGSYFCAFTYENEIQDLFGVTVPDLALNFKGTFYRMAVKTPFATLQPQEPEAAAPPKAAAQAKEQVH